MFLKKLRTATGDWKKTHLGMSHPTFKRLHLNPGMSEEPQMIREIKAERARRELARGPTPYKLKRKGYIPYEELGEAEEVKWD